MLEGKVLSRTLQQQMSATPFPCPNPTPNSCLCVQEQALPGGRLQHSLLLQPSSTSVRL